MIRIEIDSNIVDKIADTPGLLQELQAGGTKGNLIIIANHNIYVQLSATEDPSKRTRLLAVYEALPKNDVPTHELWGSSQADVLVTEDPDLAKKVTRLSPYSCVWGLSDFERFLRSNIKSDDEMPFGIGSLKALIEKTKVIAPSPVPILLEGERGTGRHHLARWIHDWSPRHAMPFVTVQCGHKSEDELGSELFGSSTWSRHTGRPLHEVKEGLVYALEIGTLFLTNIDAMPPSVQNLLVLYQRGGYFCKVDKTDLWAARIIASTTKNLEQEAQGGRFKEDLFARLVIAGRFILPPLRDRLEDLPELVRRFLKKANTSRHLSPAAFEALKRYSWPGNIRELESVINRAVIAASHSEIGLAELDLPNSFPPLECKQ